MKQTKESVAKNPVVSKALCITDLDELQKLVDAPTMCCFKIDGRDVEVPLKRMSSTVAEQAREIRRSAPPAPWVKERNDYDRENAAYLRGVELAEKKSRNFVVYSCCPAVAAKKPGLTTPEDIFRFVQGLLTENIIDLIARDAFISGISVEVTGRANFT